MTRCAGILLLLSCCEVLRAIEPCSESRPVLLVNSPAAEHWLRRLGGELVQIESFASPPSATDREWQAADWSTLDGRVRQAAPPAAFVFAPSTADQFLPFWSERLRHQGTITTEVAETSCLQGESERNKRMIRQSHALLLRLCPGDKELLDHRLAVELARQSAAALGSTLVKN